MKQKLMKLKDNRYFPLMIFGLAVLVFYLFFTRFFIKSDDGNFLGIAYDESFSMASFLKDRYMNLSGRTVGEFLLMFFIKKDIVFWKISSSALIIYIVLFFSKLSEFFSGGFSLKKRCAFCCTGLFLMIISCLNPSVFWFSGSFTYLWPFAGLIMCVSAPTFYLLLGRFSLPMCIVSFFAALLASSQEQSAAAVIALYIILLSTIMIKKLKMRLPLVMPIIPILVCSHFLFTSPGAENRGAVEAANSFEGYYDMPLLKKLFCGASVFFANTYYLSVFLTLIFTALLIICIYESADKSRALRGYLRFTAVFAVLVCVGVNVMCMALSKSLPHMVIRQCFKSGEFSAPFAALVICGFLFSAVVLSLLVILIVKNKSVGLPVGVLSAAAFGCAEAMSFSPSIFQSGQRVFFFTNMFIFTACVILFSSVRESKISRSVYTAAVIYSSLMFIIDCFAFRLFELPLMG